MRFRGAPVLRLAGAEPGANWTIFPPDTRVISCKRRLLTSTKGAPEAMFPADFLAARPSTGSLCRLCEMVASAAKVSLHSRFCPDIADQSSRLRRRLEEFDRVSGWILDEYLLAAVANHDVVAEPRPLPL
jgi:hypothetical protein